MMMNVLAFAAVVLLAAAVAGIAACHRELRRLRRGIEALDEGGGRRAAAVMAGMEALRGPIEDLRLAVAAGLEELSPNRRQTMEQRALFPPAPDPSSSRLRAAPPESAGLRLDLPRAAEAEEDRESDGETRLIPQPIAAELLGSSAGARAPVSGRAPRGSPAAVCRMCEGAGVVRARSGAVDRCDGCAGTGSLDPTDERATLVNGADERSARLPG